MPITVDNTWLVPDEFGRTPAQRFLGGLKEAHTELARILSRVAQDQIEDGTALTAAQRTNLRNRANAILALLATHVTTPPT